MRTIDGHEATGRVEVMLDKIARGKFRSRMLRSGGEHFDDFVRVDEPALAHAYDFLIIFGQRLDGLHCVRGPESYQHVAATGARYTHHHFAQLPGGGIGNACANDHLFQAQAFSRRRKFANQIARFFTRKIQRRPDV